MAPVDTVLPVIVVTRDGPDRWTASRDTQPAGRLQVLVRPDRRTTLYLREVADDAYAPLVDAALRVHDDELYVEVDEAATDVRKLLAEREFAVRRREHHYRVPTRPVEVALTGFAFVSAAGSDVDRLRELDDALRQDVPGASGWRNDPAGFVEQTFGDPEFDPATYLVAAEESTGTYAGLVRVWVRPRVSRLGLIGVLPAYRRRGLASALLARAFGVLRARGQTEVDCEVDETNVGSNTLLTRLGAHRIGGALELVRPAVR